MDSSERRWNCLKELNVGKYEKAKKEGKVDKPIIPLCDFINKKPHYFTSSSCSGRILVIDVPSRSKREAEFLFKSHSVVNVKEALEGISALKARKAWLRFDPFILHISARSEKDAQKILTIKWDAGIRRGGIHSISDGRYAIELEGSEVMAVPIMDEGTFLIDKKFLKYLLDLANKKMRENKRRFKIFEKKLYEGFRKLGI